MSTPTLSITVPHLADHLRALESERALAQLEGLDDQRYLSDLEQEIAEYRVAYVGAAVTEIATLRGQLSETLQG